MQKKNQKKYIVLYGPTAVGKTDLSLMVAERLSAEIINMDVGQFYTPLAIGTAKPAWRSFSVPHHLFDCIDTPRDYTVVEYRQHVLALMDAIWKRGNVPLLVGGSGFYLYSLLFPPLEEQVKSESSPKNSQFVYPKLLWEELHHIDPARAAALHPNDHYRIKRALDIWYRTGEKPSERISRYQPPAPYALIHLTRDRQELYTRINTRVEQMLQEGWLEEARELLNTPWQHFVSKKGLIGYKELCEYLEEEPTAEKLPDVIADIQKQTRAYAKRQETFWRMLEKKLAHVTNATVQSPTINLIRTINLTIPTYDQYISDLLSALSLFCMDIDNEAI